MPQTLLPGVARFKSSLGVVSQALLACSLLAACASNRYAALKPGGSEEEIRAKVGREERRIQHEEYALHLHPGPKPGSYTFLKFREGRLDRLGVAPSWGIDLEMEPPRPLTSREYFAVSVRLLDLGLSEEGFALMRRWAGSNPDSSAGPTFLGMLYVKGDKPDSAFAVHRAAIGTARDAKERSTHQNNLLACHIQTRRYDEGEAYALELLADKGVEPALIHSIHYNLACIYSLQNRKAKAVEQLAKAIDKGPDAFDQAFLDTDDDFDNIRTEPGFLEARSRLKPGKRKGG
jgi:tetratricopeptide (TPR) repeat protein